MNAADKLIVALDIGREDSAKRHAQKLQKYTAGFKLGLEAITAGWGKSVARYLDSWRDKGKRKTTWEKIIWWDGNFHEGPRQVAKACRLLPDYGVNMFTLDIAGAPAMMHAAKKAVTKRVQELKRAGDTDARVPLIIGSTLLPGLDREDLDMIGYRSNMGYTPRVEDKVRILAELAKECGLDGVVTSPNETPAVRKACGNDFLIINAGIRPSWFPPSDDLKRYATPAEAVSLGANYIVIGEPIMYPPKGIENPTEATKLILKEIENALQAVQQVSQTLSPTS